jgi:putative phosphoesterase
MKKEARIHLALLVEIINQHSQYMKLAIISDSHDNLPNIYKALDYIKKQGIEIIIHCGDVCAPSALKEIAKNFSGQIHLVYGNVDGDHLRMENLKAEFQNLKIHGEVGNLKLDGKKIAWIHYPDKAKELARTSQYDVIFYGHTHKPWEEIVNKTHLINPGTLAGMFAKATLAIYDTKTGKAKLVLLEKI